MVRPAEALRVPAPAPPDRIESHIEHFGPAFCRVLQNLAGLANANAGERVVLLGSAVSVRRRTASADGCTTLNDAALQEFRDEGRRAAIRLAVADAGAGVVVRGGIRAFPGGTASSVNVASWSGDSMAGQPFANTDRSAA